MANVPAIDYLNAIKNLLGDKESWNDETEYGEPRIWVSLPKQRELEICHEEYGIPPEKQYYSFRIHCSEKEFENDDFHSTMGVIDTRICNDFETNTVTDALGWAFQTALLV